MSNQIEYYKELDGLRGIAIALVLLVHTGLLGIGWVGVQLFFVLSGYLISNQFFSNVNWNKKWFLNYFSNRFFRIVPLYFIFIIISLFFFNNSKYKFPESIVYVIFLFTFLFNFFAFIYSQFSSFWGVGHLWSLCVEWQFYFIWPLIFF